jgi:hypothetical protein
MKFVARILLPLCLSPALPAFAQGRRRRGTGRVAKAAPDGYTVLMMHVGHATASALCRSTR